MAEARTRVHAAQPTRPHTYPADLPFVPGRTVQVMDQGAVRRLSWFAVDRPADLVQQLVGACASDGWTRQPVAGAHPPRLVVFTRGEWQRRIEAVQAGELSFVTLEERQVS